MGMFDEIYIEYPLPDPEAQFMLFQTKDFDNVMDIYTIDCNGRLIHHNFFYETVPEEERPFYGKPEWKDPLFRFFGSLRRVSLGDRFMYDFSGDVRFYTAIHNRWYEYFAKFENGIMKKLTTSHYNMEERLDG